MCASLRFVTVGHRLDVVVWGNLLPSGRLGKREGGNIMGHWVKSSLHIALVVVILFFIAKTVPSVGSILGLPTSA